MGLIGTARIVDIGEQPEYRMAWTGQEYERTLYTITYEQECTADTAITTLGSPGGDYQVKDRSKRVKGYSFAVMRTVWDYKSDWEAIP